MAEEKQVAENHFDIVSASEKNELKKQLKNEMSTQLALYSGAFFDELARGGVRDVVISPGSRSTPLSIAAHARIENVYVDVDERCASFFALGIAKATGRAVALICTSGTAAANYYPAVLEAESSRVPLIILSGDRPARLQQLGAPQTCDQLKIFGSHVRKFWNMPEPCGGVEQIRFVRQIAREAIAACEPHTLCSAPVHINFPFDEPLMPALELFDSGAAFECERCTACGAHETLPVVIEAQERLDSSMLEKLEDVLSENRAIALCGEGALGVFTPGNSDSWEQREQNARNLCAWARKFDIPLLADPLSQLRNFGDDAIICNYDNIFNRDCLPDFDVVVRFGRYPVSKPVFKTLEKKPHLQIVVDPLESRDFNSATATLAKMNPMDFVSSFMDGASETCVSREFQSGNSNSQRECCTQDTASDAALTLSNIAKWAELDAREAELITSVKAASVTTVCTAEGCHEVETPLEGAYVQALLEVIPDKSLLFSANSMAIRALDTFYTKTPSARESVIELGASNLSVSSDREAPQNENHNETNRQKQITLLANRGLNGIDGTLSTALGAGQNYSQTYFLTGDLTLLHDLNAFALQHELMNRKKLDEPNASNSSIIVILFNNNGGGIFDMLPQKSDSCYFERLFITPQSINFEHAANTFGVPYHLATSLSDFRDTLEKWNGESCVHLLEVDFQMDGLATRFKNFQ